MKKTLLACLAVATLLAIATPAYAITCTVDQRPAATLLVPFFQVGRTGVDALDTLVTIGNASSAPMIAHVNVYDRFSRLRLDFNIALSGFDIQALRMSDVITGSLPNTPTDTDGQPTGDVCQRQGPPGSVNAPAVYPTPGGYLRVHPANTAQSATPLDESLATTDYSGGGTFDITSQLSSNVGDDGESCPDDGELDDLAIGYIVIDHVNYCNLSDPTDPNYYDKDAIGMENNLFGEIIFTSGDGLPTYAMNPGAQTATITLYFASFTDVIPEDLSTLPFDSLKSIPLGAGQSWTGVDVVGDPAILNRFGAGKGLLLLKFTGNVVPIVTARVYFTAQGASFGTALPTYLVGPFGQVLGAQTSRTNSDQVLVGLRNDPFYRFNVSLFNASSQGGLFHLDAFTEQGEQVASRDFAVPAYSQAGVNDTDLFEPNPSKRYVLKVTNSTGALQAFASVLDRRNNDLVQVADDTPRVAAAPGETVDYFISGVGRIEDANTNTHWRTDLRFFNTSAQARDLAFEFHYMPAGSTDEKTVLSTLHLLPGQGISIDDFVGTYLNQASDTDLTVGTVLGLLKISTVAPTDVATAPLILGGRIYADLSTGTAGMQLATYSNAETTAHLGTLVMPGAQTNLRYRTNIGIFATTSQSTLARITAVRQDGSVTSTFDYQLNNPGHTGAFAQIPMTALDGIDGNPTTIKVQSVAGGPVGAYTVTVDQISADTVFVQGR